MVGSIGLIKAEIISNLSTYMAETRLKINSQLQKSLTSESVPVTNSINEQVYQSPVGANEVLGFNGLTTEFRDANTYLNFTTQLEVDNGIISDKPLSTDTLSGTIIPSVIVGHDIATISNKTIRETVTTLTDNGNGTFTHVSENGTSTTIPATTNTLTWNQATATLTSTVSGVPASTVISDASATNRGMVSTGTQIFAGDKTFQNNVTVTGTLQTNGGIKKAIRTVSATGAITINDCIVFITNGATAITLTMPTPVGNTGLGITLVRSIGSTGTITVSPGAGQIEALNGTLGATTSLAARGVYGGSAVFVSNGTNWLRTING
jgi:hypothetical protein